MAKVNGTVSSYTVSVESAGAGQVTQRIRLTLTAPRAPLVDLLFVAAPPEDFIQFATGVVTVSLAGSAFAPSYDILQTERPVYASAEETELLGQTRRRFVLSSEREPVGEGPVDKSPASAPAAPIPIPDPPPNLQP
jgi:hypothetical protein